MTVGRDAAQVVMVASLDSKFSPRGWISYQQLNSPVHVPSYDSLPFACFSPPPPCADSTLHPAKNHSENPGTCYYGGDQERSITHRTGEAFEHRHIFRRKTQTAIEDECISSCTAVRPISRLYPESVC